MTNLRKGQNLRPRYADVAMREWGVSCDAVGAILCSYRVLIDHSGMPDRVDVRFNDGLTVWGAPAVAFAIVGEGEDAFKH